MAQFSVNAQRLILQEFQVPREVDGRYVAGVSKVAA